MTIVRYLNPRNDLVFKRIFGTEKNKDILKDFLNDVITYGQKPPIKEVTLLNPVLDQETMLHKQSIVDVLCEDETGVKYIVEMQVAKVGGFEKRAQYYAARAYCSQIEKGEPYENLKEVIFLAITEYVMFPNKKDYKSTHVVLDSKTKERDLKDFSFTFIELPKFTKTKIEELETPEEKWCYFLKNANDPDDDLIKNSKEVIKKAYRELETHHWSKEELRKYEQEEKYARDAMARERYVIMEAKSEAREEGVKEGIKEGMEKGMEKGIEKGKNAATLEIARNLLSLCVDKKKIADSTGLSLKEIDEL
ncbi:PD-(D/E)XK nuclease family transposase [Candidatus Cyrtobacter comes]|uniref:PD-(D/E)XK nuclease family transposase n=1 Tax=Candidatus Cyrtobacter comes TaxID=675776 RepID=A0ABU5L9D3_9RICK|nr:Rpn family recombination-promoting nuclease/putative transposase [Candidatus Cyrtobacter comes]MDZ5762736.1 PD-(D/E)XK nuclease family transposase [Candidatus Cyrtobacter comes]